MTLKIDNITGIIVGKALYTESIKLIDAVKLAREGKSEVH